MINVALLDDVNSVAYSDEAYAASNATPAWMKTLYGADAAAAVVLVVWEILLVRSYKKKKQN